MSASLESPPGGASLETLLSEVPLGCIMKLFYVHFAYGLSFLGSCSMGPSLRSFPKRCFSGKVTQGVLP